MEKRKNKRKRKRLAPQALNMANPNALGLKILFDHNDDATSTSLRNISGSSQLSVASSSAEELNAALAPNDNAYGDWLEDKIKADKIKADNEKKQNQQAADAGTQTYFVPEKTVTFGGKKRKRKKKRKTRKKRGGLDNMCDNFAEKLSGEEYYQNRDDVTRKTADEYCINSESKNHVCDINTGNCIELDELGMPVISIATSDDESAGDESADIRESNGNNGAVDAAGMPIIPIRFGGKKRRKKRKRKKTKRKSHKRKRTRRKRNRKKRTRKRVKKLSSRKRK
tara:strand:- start:290 stop:1135 length:846 start_codon:yes stop_codon:yes gene_type:complete